MTQRAGMSPGRRLDRLAEPDRGAARDSSSTAGPPARAIAAATPPPCSSRVLAALAIASTSSAVMSASSASSAAMASTVPAMTVRKRVRAHGRVQGVFFRDSVRRAAEGAGVAGWAREPPDGTVEAVFEGSGGGRRPARRAVPRGTRARAGRAPRRETSHPSGLQDFDVL